MKSKIFKLFLLLTLSMTEIVNAQISVYNTPDTKISETNYFFDASLTEGLNNPNLGRLFGFPGIDLTVFTFDVNSVKGKVYPSFFDGALVFNKKSGTTVDGIPTEVGRGFYYFDNPNAKNITNGKWMKLGGTDYSSNAPNGVITSNSIDGKPIYSYKSTFTQVAGETKTEFDLTVPSGIKGLFKITIYNTDANYYTNSVYSLTMDPNNSGKVKLVTGVPNISVVYPAGTYNYILEYLK
ncbi:hypothetical protein [Apibacter adventoris]|uniref:hypothetical protein n=1 Tax=Apibacter adventoris TaxID=1679466 RepID=UPI0011B0EFEA|nr:hypothetical protein [Apibacter adventoris]